MPAHNPFSLTRANTLMNIVEDMREQGHLDSQTGTHPIAMTPPHPDRFRIRRR
jgi:hypothetical protein